jgi:hypothetical protein
MSETDLSRSIRQALAAMGVWVIRVQAGQHRVRGGVLQCAEPGTPDLCLPALSAWFEVKTPKGALEASQVAWHQRATREGVKVAVVRSVSEAVTTVQEWQGNRRQEAARE